ncbi:MAG: alpha-glucan family phosphorylase [Bacteroidetes bacterium]|nr:alpha-glucan family phosphorylase [Bacteroidota bacterium]
MNDVIKLAPDVLFEVSWEVCNKVGGIYTVLSTKALTLQSSIKDNYLFIGPDVWKDISRNHNFIEDKLLFKTWKQKAEKEGLQIRIGRWNIIGKPIAILVNFTKYFPEKDKIFAHLWETYHLDSLSGQWDYLEPALFGHAAAKVIESFYKFNLTDQDKIVAQFHEWMTGTGILYLKEHVPQIGTVFTTHATVVGRCIAGNGLPLYRNMSSYDADVVARQFGVISKNSLERISAHEADCFTTVSELTGNECVNFLKKLPDVYTPNGFEDSFVPPAATFESKRQAAREKLFRVAEALCNQPLARDSQLIVNSGRYEFRNKGIDIFIKALGKLNQEKELAKDIIGFILVPAYHLGPRPELLERMEQSDFQNPLKGEFLTHVMPEPENDPVIQHVRQSGLTNEPGSKVHIVFVPAYLDQADGIFGMDYYDLLIGFDGSVFPSYYEPWGYTPLESLAFHIPTITTTLTGFGLWVKSLAEDDLQCISVVDRTDDNDRDVVDNIAKIIRTCGCKSPDEIYQIRNKSFDVSRTALWKNLIEKYYEAFDVAISKTLIRREFYRGKQAQYKVESYLAGQEIKPEWKKVLIQATLPKSLEGLGRLSMNLWWTWNNEGPELFEMIDPKQWKALKYNPIALIESLSYEQIKELSHNDKFIHKLNRVVSKFDAYILEQKDPGQPEIAYFCMEYGLHDTIKIYSGGLGMLAGDYLKQASDSNINMVGVGLLYRYGYFRQSISVYGDQIADYTPQKFTHLPLVPVRGADNEWVHVVLALPGRNITAKVWQVDVGRIPLYLLDTDLEENNESDRSITHQLYGGDWENRLKQELLLGIGGIRMLELLGITPDVYHLNEGHAAIANLERMRHLIQHEMLTFNQAIEVVRATTLFTTHTPVPAGHDVFSEDLLRAYIAHYADQLTIKWEDLMNLGRIDQDNHAEKFSMSVCALKLSQEANGVSKIHGRITRELFGRIFPGYFPSELYIDYVTNGVHYPTWAARSWQQLYEKEFGEDFPQHQSDPNRWSAINKVANETIWRIRQKQKSQLIDYLLDRLSEDLLYRDANPRLFFKLQENINREAFTIGFARRFATYKRANLLFSDMERLSRILNNKRKPVQIIFAGKAHPKDKPGQDLIKTIIEVSRRPEFIGKIFFIENYDMELARYLIRGVDLWLNTPMRPQEASGTSGMKAVMNGVINLSVLDGWWAEGYKPGAGWALKEEGMFEVEHYQNELDAETIYSLLEDEIIPTYFDRGNKNLPGKWIDVIRHCIAEIAPHYTMKRQLDDYVSKFYSKMFTRGSAIRKDRFQLAKEIASWKRKVERGWESVEIVGLSYPDSTARPLSLGEYLTAEVTLDVNELSPNDLGIEVIVGKKVNDEIKEPMLIHEMEIKQIEKSIVTFTCNLKISRAGVYDFAFRMFPKHPLLPHRQDFSLVRWI